MAEIWGAAIAAAGSIGGALMSANGSEQSAPSSVGYTPVNLQQTQEQAITGNQANSSSLDQLLSQSNSFQQQQATSLMNQALPGYSGFAQNLTNTASSLASNPYAIPSSVTGQLSQYAAENNINEGTGASSGFSGSNMLRSLGINALQYGQSNMAAATNALQTLSNTAPRTSPMSPLSFMVTPAQQATNQTLTNTQAQQIGQGAANAQAAAGNANSANLYDNLTSSVGGFQGAGNTLSSILGPLLTGQTGTPAGYGAPPAGSEEAGVDDFLSTIPDSVLTA